MNIIEKAFKLRNSLNSIINPATADAQTDGSQKAQVVGIDYISGNSGIDASTESLQIIDYAHHEIHSGSSYVYRDCYSLAKAGVSEHLIVTPDTTKWAHMIIGFEASTSSITVELFEGTTVSANGTLEPTINRNRNVADNNTTLIYISPTITADGTEISKGCYGARNSAGGGARDTQEIVLKQNTNYLVRVTEANVSAINLNVSFDWYENTDKN